MGLKDRFLPVSVSWKITVCRWSESVPTRNHSTCLLTVCVLSLHCTSISSLCFCDSKHLVLTVCVLIVQCTSILSLCLCNSKQQTLACLQCVFWSCNTQAQETRDYMLHTVFLLLCVLISLNCTSTSDCVLTVCVLSLRCTSTTDTCLFTVWILSLQCTSTTDSRL